MSRRFATLDVFTGTPFTGNQLAVVLDCGGLDSAAMQAIAREFNYSETVFVLPPRDPVNLARIRIFMPTAELPFAGHPTIGAAVLLAIENTAGLSEDVNFVIEEAIGAVSCTVRQTGEGLGRARFELPRLPEAVDGEVSASLLAQALGLDVGDIGYGTHRPGRFSAGVPYMLVPVRDREAVARVKPDLSLWPRMTGSGIPDAIFVYTGDRLGAGADFHARMFAPHDGIFEDPATGSAAAAFAGALMAFEPPREGETLYVIEQGYDMGRPSRITLGLSVADGALVGATIGGEAILVSEGRLFA